MSDRPSFLPVLLKLRLATIGGNPHAVVGTHLVDQMGSRSSYTKLDWTVWTATLAEDAADFAALVEALARWADETPSRVPLTDWYWTQDGKQRGFQARSVVGGLFIKRLAERGVAGTRG